MTRFRSRAFLAVCSGLLIAAAPAGTGPAAVASGPEADDAEARRQQLNEAEAGRAAAIAAEAAATRKAHDQAVSAAQLQTLRGNAAYSAELEAHQRALDKYAADKAEWERVVAACKRGDRKICPPRKAP